MGEMRIGATTYSYDYKCDCGATLGKHAAASPHGFGPNGCTRFRPAPGHLGADWNKEATKAEIARARAGAKRILEDAKPFFTRFGQP